MGSLALCQNQTPFLRDINAGRSQESNMIRNADPYCCVCQLEPIAEFVVTQIDVADLVVAIILTALRDSPD